MRSDQEKVTRLLKTARGQVDGLLQMVENDRYCIDISNQLMATIAILKKVNTQILDDHLHHCVTEALSGDDTVDAGEKIDEIMDVMRKLSK